MTQKFKFKDLEEMAKLFDEYAEAASQQSVNPLFKRQWERAKFEHMATAFRRAAGIVRDSVIEFDVSVTLSGKPAEVSAEKPTEEEREQLVNEFFGR